MRHELKTWPEYFDAIWNGRKNFEFRDNDRDFRTGDELHLREFDPATGEYTGNWVIRYVTYVLTGPIFGLPPEKAILSLSNRPIDA